MNCEKIRQKANIRTVMESFNLFPVKENRKTAFYFALDREEKVPSLSVDFIKNKAFDFGTGKSYDVISIVQQVNKCSVSDALKYLSTLDFSTQNEFLTTEIKMESSYKIVKITEIRHPALNQYLKSRKVAEQKKWVKEIHYEQEGKKYFGIGFENDSAGYEIRNIYSKICLGKKDVTWIENENNLNNEVAVFEGFFDFLTFHNLENYNDFTCDYLILNSTAMLFKANERLMGYNKILLFLDNDVNGRSVRLKVQSQYKNVEDCSLMYCNYKDLNDWFCRD